MSLCGCNLRNGARFRLRVGMRIAQFCLNLRAPQQTLTVTRSAPLRVGREANVCAQGVPCDARKPRPTQRTLEDCFEPKEDAASFRRKDIVALRALPQERPWRLRSGANPRAFGRFAYHDFQSSFWKVNLLPSKAVDVSGAQAGVGPKNRHLANVRCATGKQFDAPPRLRFGTGDRIPAGIGPRARVHALVRSPLCCHVEHVFEQSDLSFRHCRRHGNHAVSLILLDLERRDIAQ